jgi:hypothetical protein
VHNFFPQALRHSRFDQSIHHSALSFEFVGLEAMRVMHGGAIGVRARIAVEGAHPPQKQAKDGAPSVFMVKARSKTGHPPPLHFATSPADPKLCNGQDNTESEFSAHGAAGSRTIRHEKTATEGQMVADYSRHHHRRLSIRPISWIPFILM